VNGALVAGEDDNEPPSLFSTFCEPEQALAGRVILKSGVFED
jgi:hypothetical protein